MDLYMRGFQTAISLASLRRADVDSSRMDVSILQSQVDELKQSISDLNAATFGGANNAPENAPIYRRQFVRVCQNRFYQGMSIFYKQYFKEHLLHKILQFSEYQEEQMKGLHEELEGFRCRDESVVYEFKDLNDESRTSPSPTFSGAISDKSQADSVSVSSTDVAAASKASSHVTVPRRSTRVPVTDAAAALKASSHVTIPSQSTRPLVPQAGSSASTRKKAYEWDGKKLILDSGLKDKLDPMLLHKFNSYFTHNDAEFNIFWNKLCFNGKVLQLTYTSPIDDEVMTKPYSWPNLGTLMEALILIIDEGRFVKFKQVVHLLDAVWKVQNKEESSGQAGSQVPLGKQVPHGKPSKQKQPAQTAGSSKKKRSVSPDKAYAMKKAADDCAFCLYLVKHEKLLRCVIAAPFPAKDEGNDFAHPLTPDEPAELKEFGRTMSLANSISKEEKNKEHREALYNVLTFVKAQLGAKDVAEFENLVPKELTGKVDTGSQPSGGGKVEGQSQGESEGEVLVPEQPAGSIISGTPGAGKGKEVRFG
ncbi:hypothetical protein ACEPAF_2639 [Sanghuangporus sanghuang]